MEQELFEQLKKKYTDAMLVVAAKWLAETIDGNDEEAKYDLPLVTVYYKDFAEENPFEYPLMQVRVRDDMEGRGREIVLVFSSEGCFKTIEEPDEELRYAAEVMDKYCFGFLEKFPDCVLRYEWYGDDKTIKPDE